MVILPNYPKQNHFGLETLKPYFGVPHFRKPPYLCTHMHIVRDISFIELGVSHLRCVGPSPPSMSHHIKQHQTSPVSVTIMPYCIYVKRCFHTPFVFHMKKKY